MNKFKKVIIGFLKGIGAFTGYVIAVNLGLSALPDGIEERTRNLIGLPNGSAKLMQKIGTTFTGLK